MRRGSTALVVATIGLLNAGVITNTAQAAPSARGFVCSAEGGIPSTKAIKSDGKQVSIIRWTSNVFDSAGWTQERRCQEVSARFDQYLKEGRLKYLTTGRMNGVPVICTAQTQGGACDGLLYTLKPGQDATATLQSLVEIRNRARGPLNETNSRMYVSIDELLNKDQASINSEPNNHEQAPTGKESQLF